MQAPWRSRAMMVALVGLAACGDSGTAVTGAGGTSGAGTADEPLRYAYRKADQGNGADSPAKHTGGLTWHAPNAVGPHKLTISVIDPYGGRAEKDITITLK